MVLYQCVVLIRINLDLMLLSRHFVFGIFNLGLCCYIISINYGYIYIDGYIYDEVNKRKWITVL